MLGDWVSRAKVRYYPVGPRKVRQVADLVRGLTVKAAQDQLAAIHKPSGAPIISRALKSAFCNANQSAPEGTNYEPENLVIGTIDVDGGPIAYRFHPMPMGRAGKIRKRSCHLTIELYEPLHRTLQKSRQPEA